MWFFSFTQRVGVVQLVFESFLKGIVAYVAVCWVCPWEERSSGSFYVATLNWSPIFSFDISFGVISFYDLFKVRLTV